MSTITQPIVSSDIKVVTVATGADGYFNQFKESCKRYDIDPIILGWDQPWTGFQMKINLFRQYLDTVSPDQLVLLVDSYDLVFNDTLDKLQTFFSQKITSGQWNTDSIYFSVENKTDLQSFFLPIAFKLFKGKLINTGSYIGRAQAIKNYLDYACSRTNCSSSKVDDQRLVSTYFENYPDNIQLDTDFDFFSIYGRLDEHISGSFTHNELGQVLYNGKIPLLLHFNDNRDARSMLSTMGYDMKDVEHFRKNGYGMRLMVHHFSHIISKYGIYLAIFLCFFFIIILFFLI